MMLRQAITGPATWTGADWQGDESWLRTLSGDDIARSTPHGPT